MLDISDLDVVRAGAFESKEKLAAQAQRRLHEVGFAVVSFVVADAVKAAVAAEVEHLVAEHGVRRDLVFAETGDTARRMRNVRRRDIAEYGRVVPAVYADAPLRAALSKIAGEPVLECPYQPEQYVITELTEQGDTHGWHWDDYSFALVWVIDCPPLEDGGFVQAVPHTQWDKSDPRLHHQFVEHPIHSLELVPGDVYLMRTDTTLHRVYPITAGRRLIVNMAYAADRDLAKPIAHETMDSLWSE